jgi:PIN domain nuclease of toxin-antitoxin system
MLESGDYQIFVSAATCWEMAVKTQKGKWDFKEPTALALRWAQSLDARWLLVEPYDVLILETIPMLHADPFDWMLLAQAARGSMPLLTIDEDLHRYAKVKIPPAPGLPRQTPEIIW